MSPAPSEVRDEALLFRAARLQHVWLLHTWPALDEGIASDDPLRLGAYLCLGWTQACTTWNWPGTAQWREILRGEPPAHWWPRAHFHLCWLVHDPSAPEHQAGLRQALDAGQQDAALPDVARALALRLNFV